MTEFDTHLGYAKLDAWAKFPNFQAMVRDVIVRQQALDRMMIGFNGTSAAAQGRFEGPLASGFRNQCRHRGAGQKNQYLYSGGGVQPV